MSIVLSCSPCVHYYTSIFSVSSDSIVSVSARKLISPWELSEQPSRNESLTVLVEASIPTLKIVVNIIHEIKQFLPCYVRWGDPILNVPYERVVSLYLDGIGDLLSVLWKILEIVRGVVVTLSWPDGMIMDQSL